MDAAGKFVAREAAAGELRRTKTIVAVGFLQQNEIGAIARDQRCDIGGSSSNFAKHIPAKDTQGGVRLRHKATVHR